MAIKQIKATTSSQRFKRIVDRSDLWKGGPVKKLTAGIKRCSGRNNRGRITVRGKGGGNRGNRKVYRIIDFKQKEYLDKEGRIERIEYDPNRSANICLIRYENGDFRYNIASQGSKVGDIIVHNSEEGEVALGSSLPLRFIPTGVKIFNLEIKPGKGAQMIRAAGTFATLLAKEGGYGLIRLKSGEVRKFPLDCRASIGAASNPDHKNISLGKAGASRNLGRKPKVRGVAMNPIDHPHGGGEGKTSSGRHPVTPWGKLTKGKKTRKRRLSPLVVTKRNNRKAGS